MSLVLLFQFTDLTPVKWMDLWVDFFNSKNKCGKLQRKLLFVFSQFVITETLLPGHTESYSRHIIFSKKGKLDANQISKMHEYVKMTPARWTVTPVEFNSLFLTNLHGSFNSHSERVKKPKTGIHKQLKRKMHKFTLNVFLAPPKKRPVALHLIVFFHSRPHNW